ncbi:MAG: hypothetical protein COA45_11365 [Zetaproteobacteria bacterium]|nr:MAG: hypothetical protein COA45_11365 [Zetaproteobacteria bacterium]
MKIKSKILNHFVNTSVFDLIPLSLRQSVLYALALFFSKGIGFLMIPVFTHFLEPADYGRLDILQTLADLLSIVLIMGLSDTLFKFYGEARSEEEKVRVAANIFGMALFICAASTIILQLCAPMLQTILPGDVTIWQTRFILISLSVSACLLIPLCWHRMKDRAGQYFILSTARVMIQALLSALFLYAGFGVTGVMAAGALAALICSIKVSYDFIRDYGAAFDFRYWRKFFLYGSPLILTGLAGFILGSFDRWILAEAAGPEVMAKYALAAKFGLLTALLVQPFELWWNPKRFEVLNNNNGPEICAKNISTGLVIVALSILCISTGAPLAITVMTPNTYHDAIIYVPFLSTLAGIHAATLLMNIGIYNVKITKWPAIIDMSAAGIALAGYLILIPLFAAWGAISATAIALTLRFTATLILSQRIAPLPYEGVVLSGLGSLTFMVVGVLAQEFDLLSHIAIGGLGFFVLIIYALYVGLLPPLKLHIGVEAKKCSS